MHRKLTEDELQARLAELGGSSADNGTLEMIVCRPNAGERRVLEHADLSLADGLIGDNWRARGSRHTEDGSAHLEMQITLMNSRIIQVIAQDRSRWPLAGDQLFIDLDLSYDNLPPGQRIAIGTVVLEITDVPHIGCKKFTERYGRGASRFVNSSEGRQLRRRGVNSRIIHPGALCIGDIVSKIKFTP